MPQTPTNRITGLITAKGGTRLFGEGASMDPNFRPTKGQIDYSFGTQGQKITTPSKASHGGSHSYSSHSSSVATKAAAETSASSGINAAALGGGIVAAGIAADAIAPDNKENNGIGGAIVGGMDAVAGVAGSVLGASQTPIMALMLGAPLGLGAMNLATKGIDKVGGTKTNVFATKLSGGFGKMQEATFGDVAKKMGVNENVLGKNIAGTSAMQGAMHATFVAGSGLAVYGAAREFGTQATALRQLIADQKGVKLSDISLIAALTSGDLSDSAKKARSQLLKISGAHILSSVAGLGMMLKTNAVDSGINKVLGRFGLANGVGGFLAMNMAYMLPEQLSTMVEGIVGEPILEVYKGMSDAEKAGHKFEVQDIQQFILRANEGLRNRGSVGEQIAAQLGDKYLNEGLKLSAILTRMDKGEMKDDIDAILKSNEQHKAAPAEMSHVERLKQQRSAPQATVANTGEVVGDFTKKLNEKAAALAAMPASPSMN